MSQFLIKAIKGEEPEDSTHAGLSALCSVSLFSIMQQPKCHQKTSFSAVKHLLSNDQICETTIIYSFRTFFPSFHSICSWSCASLCVVLV